MEEPEQEVVEQTAAANLPRLETTAKQRRRRTTGAPVFDVQNVSIYYGAFSAVTDVSLTDPRERDHRVHRLVRLRQVDGAAHAQPDERPGRRRPGGGRDPLPRRVDLYASGVSPTAVRRRIGMVFQKPNPFPKSIYDNVAYGPRINGMRNKAKLDEIVERSLRRRRCGTR